MLWGEARDVTPFAGREGAVWRMSVKPTDAPKLTASLTSLGVHHSAIYDWSGGLIWILVEDRDDIGAAVLRQQVEILGGHATLFRAKTTQRQSTPIFHPQPAPLAKLEAGLRMKFDPRGILNPGLMA
jgi:glycolate oxidase FAD binding subunit